MKNPTKAQRHAIYKKALRIFDQRPTGLCIIIAEADGKWAEYWWEVKIWYPEFAQQYKPTEDNFFGMKGSKWSASDDPMGIRRKALLRCIELSAPKPRK